MDDYCFILREAQLERNEIQKNEMKWKQRKRGVREKPAESGAYFLFYLFKIRSVVMSCLLLGKNEYQRE